MTRALNKLSALAGRNVGPGKLSEGDAWTIPGGKQKGRKDKTPDFRVPLVPETLSLIKQTKPLARDGYLFPSIRKGVISDATMARLMERRVLFGDWAKAMCSAPKVQ
ncbi:hypothetical protein JQ506_18195 [Shinella sp. PSBB067]|uniref:hypothetical protein n=1 Tax=Shinella sp. PSBB067 TaxID=2715959 RepID=UPI00193B64FC|nr:hypothetical protein JQ506_18195 [Shinella sp. PSBB067]